MKTFSLACVCVGVCLATGVVAQSVEVEKSRAEDQMMAWMMYDGHLDEHTGFGVVEAELMALREELPLVSSRLATYRNLFDRQAISETQYREKEAYLNKISGRANELEHRLAYYKAGVDLTEILWKSRLGQTIDLARVQELFWDKWQHRCEAFKEAKVSILPRQAWFEWRLATHENLERQGGSTQDELLFIKTELIYLRQKIASIDKQQEICKSGPPFPKFADMGFAKQ